MNKISKLLFVLIIIFSAAILQTSRIFAANEQDPGPAREWANKASKAIDDAKYDEALSYANKALEIDPNYAGAYNLRGLALYYKDEKDLSKKAVEDFDKAIKLNPKVAAYYKNRGNAKSDIGLYAEDIQDQDTAIKLSPNDANAYANRGSAYFKKKMYDQAIADYSRALKIDPNNFAAYRDRANAYYRKDDLAQAMPDYDRAIKLDPKDAQIFSYRARAYSKQGKNDLATADLRKAVDIDPKNQKFRQELVKLEGGSAPSERMLAPFNGYSLDDPCAQVNSGLAGEPWQDESVQDNGPVSAEELGQYQALLRHTMQGLHLFYGTLTQKEENTFNAFWALFFDFPNKAALEYFKQITPLLDELAVTLNSLDGALAEFGEAMQGMLLVSADPQSSASGIAALEYESVKSQRAKLDEIAKKIAALGNPPNPLAAKCRARKRHKQAISAPAAVATTSAGPDILAALRETNHFEIIAINANMHSEKEGYITEWEWEGNAFKFVFQTNSEAFNYNSPCLGTTVCGVRQEVSGILSEDGKLLKKLVYKKGDRCCDRATQGITEPQPMRFEAVDIPILEASKGAMGITVKYGGESTEFNKHITALEGGTVCNYVGCDIKISFTKQTPWAQVDAWSLKFDGLKAGVTSVAAASGKGQLQDKGLAQVDPGKDPQVIKEAIAEHMALAEQASRDAKRWLADAKAEKDDKRRKELEDRAADFFNNAQAEEDIAASLRTGTIVHTRTEWDERQHQALVESAKKEIAIIALENKLLANIPKVGDMVGGIEGVTMREQAQAKISEALKSPNRLEKLADIYAQLQNKVVNQGGQQMATEQAKVELWDNRITVAENVQFGASMGVLFGALWAPAEIGSLALGFAGSTGFAEGGVKGAVIAITRSVSPRADIIISAYEGAARIDPATDQPEGAWGAIKGALWSIGANKAFEKLGSRIQKAKADYALNKQAAGGAGVKAVARAKGEAQLKEYDFKTPEERFKAEFTSAKTPQQKAVVEKKYAIQAEREKMHLEGEASLKKAEEAIQRGEDPAKVKEQYNKDLNTINEKYKDKTRNKEHEEVMKELGFDPKKDIKPTGSAPKTAASDMDFTPEGATPHEAYQKGKSYVEAMKKRGHSVEEYGDRWVDNTNDSTIWKPGFGADKPGSSSFDAEVIFGTLPHSDKFGTKGGIEWTSSSTHTTDDPLGAVLANAGKAAAAGLGNSHPKDLHTIGKSAVKAAEAAGIEVEPQLKSQIDALKAHQTPEQAGVLELGANKAAKDRQEKAFLSKVEALMGKAYNSAKAKSGQRSKELQPEPADKSDAAYAIRVKLGAYKAGNDAALTTIAQASPGLGKAMAPGLKVSEITPDVSTAKLGELNLGGFAKEMFGDRDKANKAMPPPANANDPAFSGLGKRCKEAAIRVQDKLNAAKSGSDEVKYLAELKVALEQGEKNPAQAMRSVRGVSGEELAVVLAQLGVK